MVESDEEQLEVLKNWWSENGTSLIITVVVSLGAIMGYRGWEANVKATGEAASAAYENLVTATDGIIAEPGNDALRATATTLGQTLKDEYGDTAYATFAALRLAKEAVRNNDLDAAISELRWALDKADEPHLQTMIRVRLARVYLAKEDPTSAMTLLVNHQPPKGQVSSFEEAKGDVFHNLGDLASARQSYQKALENLGDGMQKPILEIKLADLPLAAESPIEASNEDALTEDDDA